MKMLMRIQSGSNNTAEASVGFVLSIYSNSDTDVKIRKIDIPEMIQEILPVAFCQPEIGTQVS